MTDELRDVLRRCSQELINVIQSHPDVGTTTLQECIRLRDDVRCLLAADEDAAYLEEAREMIAGVLSRVFDATAVAAWLKARDQRRKEAEHGK